MWAVIGILGALRAREQTGQGAIVDVAMSEATLPFAMAQLGALAVQGTAARGGEALTGGIAPYATYRTKDDRWVSLGALEPKFWKAFCDGVGLDLDMTAMMPGAHQPALKARLAEVFAGRTRDEWATFGAERDCCLEPVLEPHELAADPHLAARQVLHRQATPWGESLQIRLPVAPPADGPAPSMGGQTREILLGAGHSAAEVDALLATHVAREA
jgi:crotonobetainyl-CoA:carnitine CoA-transferase CaiB-like acyl-CoA transferase